jgi:hypothetical protein
MDITDQYKRFFIDLKSPTLKGIISPEQQNVIDQLKMRGYNCLVVRDDYDDTMHRTNDYISKRVLVCPSCTHNYKSDNV